MSLIIISQLKNNNCKVIRGMSRESNSCYLIPLVVQRTYGDPNNL